VPILILAVRCLDIGCARRWASTVLAITLHRACPFCGSARWEVQQHG
jgi:hypothetical protein